MSVKLPDIEQWLEAMGPVLQLDVPADLRGGVKANLKTAAKMAAVLDKASIKDGNDPAPVYRA